MRNPLTLFVTIRILAALGLFLTLPLTGSSLASADTLPDIATWHHDATNHDRYHRTVPASEPVEQVPQEQAESPTGKALMTVPISSNLSGEDAS